MRGVVLKKKKKKKALRRKFFLKKIKKKKKKNMSSSSSSSNNNESIFKKNSTIISIASLGVICAGIGLFTILKKMIQKILRLIMFGGNFGIKKYFINYKK